MEKIEERIEITSHEQLYRQYNWFHKTFFPSVQKSCDEFFPERFSLKLASVSENINLLFQGEDYFVTKIKLDKQHDVFVRCSSSAAKIILDSILGKAKKFELSKITELEAKIISSFNDYLYENSSRLLLPLPPKNQKRKNFNFIHLTFFLKEKHSQDGAKLILSLPKTLLAPETLNTTNEDFSITSYKNSKLDAKIKIGTTTFPLKDIKNLEKEDIVIFENSDIHSMKIIYKDYKKVFRINPNLGLVTSISNDNGGHKMEDNSLSQNLWDNIQVEMGAEFEKVKITLGELKNIEEGLVVDISSVYDNKVSLTVENKTIAKGELVIINDRYGVRIDEVMASEKEPEPMPVAGHHPEDENLEQHQEGENSGTSDDEEFDYSDFELEDEDI